MKTERLPAVMVVPALMFSTCLAGGPAEHTLVVPAASETLHLALALPEGAGAEPSGGWLLVESGFDAEPISVDLQTASTPLGQPAERVRLLLANLPVRQGAGKERLFRLKPVSAALRKPANAIFEFKDLDGPSLGLWERQQPVLVYNHGRLSKEGVPADRNRSTYIHPLHGLNGEVLTDDFPADHYHHRGLFWAWPHVQIDGQHYDLWMLQGVEQRFERWLAREGGIAGASLGVENGWYVGSTKVVEERVWMRVFAATPEARAIDLEFTWLPLEKPLTLRGAEGKSYGGLTLRFAPRSNTVITVPDGKTSADLSIAPLPWADLTAQFKGVPHPSGAAIFIGPDHPDYPPTWLTRHYGVLCVGWPGVEPRTFPPGQPIRCHYRLWIHKEGVAVERLRGAYAGFEAGEKARWKQASE